MAEIVDVHKLDRHQKSLKWTDHLYSSASIWPAKTEYALHKRKAFFWELLSPPLETSNRKMN